MSLLDYSLAILQACPNLQDPVNGGRGMMGRAEGGQKGAVAPKRKGGPPSKGKGKGCSDNPDHAVNPDGPGSMAFVWERPEHRFNLRNFKPESEETTDKQAKAKGKTKSKPSQDATAKAKGKGKLSQTCEGEEAEKGKGKSQKGTGKLF